MICTGGFQTASFIREAIRDGAVDGVSIARSLVANNDLVQQWAAGHDRPERPCTYCNRCLVSAMKNPMGCYDDVPLPEPRRDDRGGDERLPRPWRDGRARAAR